MTSFLQNNDIDTSNICGKSFNCTNGDVLKNDTIQNFVRPEIMLKLPIWMMEIVFSIFQFSISEFSPDQIFNLE